MEFKPVFEYYRNDKQKMIDTYKITPATFYNWKRSNKISLGYEKTVQILTNDKFIASEKALFGR